MAENLPHRPPTVPPSAARSAFSASPASTPWDTPQGHHHDEEAPFGGDETVMGMDSPWFPSAQGGSPHTAAPPSVTKSPPSQMPQAWKMTSNATLSRNQTVLPRLSAGADGKMELVHLDAQRYQPLKKLGEGGAGEVVLVKDNDIRRMVAMKRIKEDKRNAAQIIRFLEEVQTVGQLEHPNIVPIHDVGIDNEDNYYFTMKFVQGETLSEIIDKLRAGDESYHKRYSFERRVHIFIEILQAINFAHQHGYIHRDIKPENIMIGEYGEIQVMDWGIAKKIREVEQFPTPQVSQSTQQVIDRIKNELGDSWGERVFQTQQGQLIGTPAYMSPEQAMGYPLDEHSDIYSLTALFYEFVNLRHYLEHKTTLTDLLMGIVRETPLDSEQLSNPHQGPVPREICFFLRRGLQKDPEHRFQSVREMLDEMQANLEGRICVHCPSTLLKRGAHEYGRYLDNHRILGVVFFCLLTIVLGIGLFQTVRWLAALAS
ncbi:MAG: serine/threonine protein kinase [Myxococcales bacterium]|nr:serine/threonine protein kinase [Myxococcales bacterium]